MRKQGTGRFRRATLTGWSAWLPFVVVPFVVMFSETWLRTEQLKQDYETSRITAAMRRIDEQMNDLRVHEAGLDNMDRMQANAPHLGLVEPTRDQIQVVNLESPDMDVRDESPIALAQAQAPMSFLDVGDAE